MSTASSRALSLHQFPATTAKHGLSDGCTGSAQPKGEKKDEPRCTYCLLQVPGLYIFKIRKDTFMEKHQTLLKYTDGNSEKRLKSLRSTQKGEICVSQGLIH